MVTVASLFSSFFLEGVAAAVERRHYPNLPPAAGTSFVDNLREGISFLGLIIIVNILALVVYVLFNVAAPLVFWVVNGILLGREYFFLVAMRRVGRSQAKDLRARHSLEVWAAGVLMAVPLTVPVVNILVPILGAATFTHLYHRLADH
ncbi:MAG: EI24 domain-containing protein [Pseudomonadota bacterium]